MSCPGRGAKECGRPALAGGFCGLHSEAEQARRSRDATRQWSAAREGRALDRHLALHAFGEGFKVGADPLRARRRNLLHIDPAMHAHWKAGYEAGREAATVARDTYDIALTERRRAT